MAGKMETFYQQAVHRYKDFTDKQLHQYITRKLTAWCQIYHPKPPSTESADNEAIDSEEGEVVNVAGGEAAHTTTLCMSEGDEDGEEESAAPAAGNAAAPSAAAPVAAAESGGNGAGPPAAGGAVDT